MPPLPVSSTKFSVSLKSSSVACRITIPPVSSVNEMVVTNFAGGGTNSSCANNLQPKRSRMIMLNSFIILFRTVSVWLFWLQFASRLSSQNLCLPLFLINQAKKATGLLKTNIGWWMLQQMLYRLCFCFCCSEKFHKRRRLNSQSTKAIIITAPMTIIIIT